MFKLFSESTQYAIQTMIHLACNPKEKTMVSAIAKSEDIPAHYLGKIAQTLAKNHLIKTSRGRTGGILLNKAPEKIKVIDIVVAINGSPRSPEMCVFGLDFCTDSAPCPVHPQWKKMKTQLKEKLMNQDLRTLATELLKKHDSMKS